MTNQLQQRYKCMRMHATTRTSQIATTDIIATNYVTGYYYIYTLTTQRYELPNAYNANYQICTKARVLPDSTTRPSDKRYTHVRHILPLY